MGEWTIFSIVCVDPVKNMHPLPRRLVKNLKNKKIPKAKKILKRHAPPPPRLFKNGVKVFDRSPRPPTAGKQFGFVGKKTFARISFHE